MKPLLASLVGLTTLGVAVGGGLYKFWPPKIEQNDPNKTYLLVHIETPENSVDPKITGTTGGYHCEWNKFIKPVTTDESSNKKNTETVKDEECKFIKINFDNTKKSVDLSGIKNSTERIAEFSKLIPSNKPHSMQQYLVQTSKTHADLFKGDQFHWQAKVVSKTSETTSIPVFVSGMFNTESENWKFLNKSWLAIAKLDGSATVSDDSAKPYKCYFENQESPYTGCSVVKTDQTNFENIDFSKITMPTNSVTPPTTSQIGTDGQYHIIEMGSSLALTSDETLNKKIITFEEFTTADSQTAKKKAIFSIEALIVGDLTDKKQTIVILK